MEPMITFLITLLLAFLPMVAHLYIDYYRMKKGEPIMHKRGATMVVVLAVGLGFLNKTLTGVEPMLFAALALCTHLPLFDIIWNKIEGHKWNYLGTESNPNRALTDKLWSKLPEWLQALLRIAFLAAGWYVYLKFK